MWLYRRIANGLFTTIATTKPILSVPKRKI